MNRAITFKNNQPVIGPPKSEASIRDIPLDAMLARTLQPFKQAEGFIVHRNGQPLTERTYQRMWQRIGKRIHLHGATPHVLRHTYITLAASSGLDIKTLQTVAGHADSKMTMNRYTHQRREKTVEAGALIDGVITHLVTEAVTA